MTKDEADNWLLEWCMSGGKLKAPERAKPKGITRYNEHQQEAEDGEFVTWGDHMLVVEKMQAKIDEAYSEGKSDGRDSTYSWRL